MINIINTYDNFYKNLSSFNFFFFFFFSLFWAAIYGQMERGVLSGGVAGIDPRGVNARIISVQGVELGETVQRMEESIAQVILLLEAAMERCINFIGGFEADELILALDHVTLQYISTFPGIIKSLRASLF
ncbi:hypothetical protein ACJIZ3_023536 [Penstemon smallii]|uniref:Conserved oligomeric Golgi complex subunit 7 n=1 Tax=Penstemon smallii TaxID=265156 RepID=A0ABD3TRQ1_9LAMI